MNEILQEAYDSEMRKGTLNDEGLAKLTSLYNDKVESLKSDGPQEEDEHQKPADLRPPPEGRRNTQVSSSADSESTGQNSRQSSMEVVELDGALLDADAEKQAREFAAKLGQLDLGVEGGEPQNTAGGITSKFRKRRLTTVVCNILPQRAASRLLGPRKSSAVLYRAQELTGTAELPFPDTVVGMNSCHGVEPSYYDVDGVTAKINQDRGCVVYPFGNHENQVLFAVLDGHGEYGDLVSNFCMMELKSQLEVHPDLDNNPGKALTETYIAVDETLRKAHKSEAEFSGTTLVSALIRGDRMWIANVGDSRIVVAKEALDGSLNGKSSMNAKDLSVDHNPNSPAEEKRILAMGGYISPPPEPGLSARVWLDAAMTRAGLAMARSIGDFAVKSVGVIAEPDILEYDIAPEDRFIILASDGVWEFLSSQDAVDIVQEKIGRYNNKLRRNTDTTLVQVDCHCLLFSYLHKVKVAWLLPSC